MSRLPHFSVKQPRPDSTKDIDGGIDEPQWWIRLMFAGVSAISTFAMLEVLSALLQNQDVLGVFLLSVFALIATGFAVLAAPRGFQDRFMRPLLIATLVLELLVNVLFVFQ